MGAPGGLAGRGRSGDRQAGDWRGPEKRLAGLRRQEENREVLEGPPGARGPDGEPNFQEERGAAAPLPTHSGRFTERVSACLHSPKTWARSSGDGSETR